MSVALLTLAEATGTGTEVAVGSATDNVAVLIGGLAAVATLTVTTPANNETVTIGITPGVVYTFKTTLTGAANEVLLGATPAAALDNLKSAVNGTAGEGTTYGTGTVANTSVSATTNTDTTQLFVARVPGTVGNAYVSTETGATMAFGGATFASGTQTATGSTATIEASYDNKITWVTELTMANPAMGTVASTQRVALSGATHIRANTTVYVAPTMISATLQSWRNGIPVN
jgi:hypothetical protein